MKIYKYILNGTHTVLELPKYSTVLSVQMQNDVVTLWIEISDNPHTEERTFSIIHTGQNYLKGIYLGTVQNFRLVYHIFENLVV
jgi:hypothetical protein